MTEEELRVIQKYYAKLKEFSQSEKSLQQSHSIEEAHKQHEQEVRGNLNEKKQV